MLHVMFDTSVHDQHVHWLGGGDMVRQYRYHGKVSCGRHCCMQ